MISECLVVEVRVTEDDCPLSVATRKTGTTVDARPPQLRSDGNALLQFSTDVPETVDPPAGDSGAVASPTEDTGSVGHPDDSEPADPVASGRREDGAVDPSDFGSLAEALDRDDRIRYLHAARSGDRLNFRCLSKHPCVVHALTDAGFVVESIEYRRGTERHTGAVVGYDVLEGVLAAGARRSEDDDGAPGIAVERIHPLGAQDDQPVASRWSVTPAQEEAIRTALAMGYFEVPRGADAGTVAAEIGISKSAFLERLRRAQRTLFEDILE